VVKAIWVILVLYQSILKQGEEHINTLCVYKDNDFIFGHIDVTHLDIIIIIFFLLN